ncbi:hypothetical protein [Ferrovibrio terrae]|uniref:hypothetical protein n=1 Tax=Ferrovibrio terrae TaxID=2594003 RepID=UPI003137BF3F
MPQPSMPCSGRADGCLAKAIIGDDQNVAEHMACLSPNNLNAKKFGDPGVAG